MKDGDFIVRVIDRETDFVAAFFGDKVRFLSKAAGMNNTYILPLKKLLLAYSTGGADAVNKELEIEMACGELRGDVDGERQ